MDFRLAGTHLGKFRPQLLVLLLMAALLSASLASAKVLSMRIGVGFNSQIQAGLAAKGFADSITSQSVSVKYWINEAVGVQGLFGFSSYHRDSQGAFDILLGGKLLYNIIQEENMNFYFSGGLAALVLGIDSGKKHKEELGVSIFPGVGFEWFFSGLPNLGFSTEVGLQLSFLDDYHEIGSYGGAFGLIGIHYYF